MISLTDLIKNHKSKVIDKWTSYIRNYERLFLPLRNEPVNILEIGICNGGSLEIWAEYFPSAKNIVGVDINPICQKFKYKDKRISTIIGDSTDETTYRKVQDVVAHYDIIIDDGSHQCEDVIKTFSSFLRLSNIPSLYIIEDTHTSYWSNFQGALRMPLTTMAFFKRIADIVNAEHWRLELDRKAYLKPFTDNYGIEFLNFELSYIHSIQFINSMIVIELEELDNNVLGKRMVKGTEEKAMPLLYGDGAYINRVSSETIDDWQYDPVIMVEQISKLLSEKT